MLDGNCNLEGEDQRHGHVPAPFIPRPISSSMHQHKQQQQQQLLLALPPSTNSPAIFKNIYQSTVIVDLPPIISDVVPQILSFCDARTLSRASCVCRSWSRMANANELWTQLCKQHFGVVPSELKPPPDPTRFLYILSHLKLRETLCFRGASFGRGWVDRGGIQVISASSFQRSMI